jgi:KUP system potassium uptake protein
MASLGALGVVFGDIGTSPLYTLQVAGEVHGLGVGRADVLGVISLVVWALILAVSLKYVTFVMRADNRGEGGIIALLALLPPSPRRVALPTAALFVIAGAALLLGDGMITPAISVLGAFEGLNRAEPALGPYVVPFTCVVLVLLFALQPRGTGAVAKLFGPLMAVWFLTIGVLGIKEVARSPEVLGALSPYWGASYFARHGLGGLRILGVVVLAITGGEALYADMGYFGARPIRVAWFGLVLPALTASYLGQGALLLRDPASVTRPFFSMVAPGPAAYALVGLSTVATVIASQALISGAFTLARQAVQLEYFPRLTIVHTSHEAEEHVYVPFINWGLMVACVALVLGFRHSERLAGAYGIAVSGTMLFTTLVFFQVTRKTWRWSLARAVPLLLLFLSFDVPFLLANALKFLDGGYIPVAVGAAFFVVMTNWHVGRQHLRRALERDSMPIAEFLERLPKSGVVRVPGTAIYLTTSNFVPSPLRIQAAHTRSLAETVLLVTVVIEPESRLEKRTCDVEPFTSGFYRVRLHYGYMEHVSVPDALRHALDAANLHVDLTQATYFVGRQTIVPSSAGQMKLLPERFFAFLQRNTKSAVDHFDIPSETVVELGMRLDL